MNDKPVIIVGLVIALIVLTFPFWYALAAGNREPRPELELPDGGQCVRDTNWMRAHHMDLLDQWRDEVVRQGNSDPIDVNGQQIHKSLTRGCMSCHTSRQDFCHRCHNYADVRPSCWNCHVEPKGVESDG